MPPKNGKPDDAKGPPAPDTGETPILEEARLSPSRGAATAELEETANADDDELGLKGSIVLYSFSHDPDQDEAIVAGAQAIVERPAIVLRSYTRKDKVLVKKGNPRLRTKDVYEEHSTEFVDLFVFTTEADKRAGLHHEHDAQVYNGDPTPTPGSWRHLPRH